MRRFAGLLGLLVLVIFISACSNGPSSAPPPPPGSTNQPPVASFTAAPPLGTAPLSVTFNASASSDPDGTIASFVWDFGDNSTGTGATAQHTYTTAGIITVRLTVTDNDGASASAARTVEVVPAPVNDPPTALFTATPISGTAPLVVSFDAVGSNDPDGTITGFAWDFGDNTTGAGPTLQHTYSAVGTYTARLTVTDNDGASAIMTRQIQVLAQLTPIALFTTSPNSGVAPLTVDFNAATSSDPDGGTLAYAWDFGDNTIGAGVAPQHVYTASGLYTATLTVTDDEGTTAIATQTINATGFTNTFNLRSPLGTNFSGILYFSGDYPFVDFFKASREWVSVLTVSPFTFGDGRSLNLDANGWVRSLQADQMASTAFLVENQHNSQLANQQFIVRYDGLGAFDYANVTINSRAPGRDVITFTGATGGIHLNITATDPNNYIRNIRIVPAGGICIDDPLQLVPDASACPGTTYRSFEDNTQQIMFHPVFLERIKTYASYRFMNWGKTNGSLVSNWDQRAKPTDARWSTKGVPIEVMVQLANLMDADPWICIPHLADDDYVHRAAQLIRDNMEPGRRAYIEYSNEVWNTAPDFPQTIYALNQGIALGLNTIGNQTDNFVGVLRFYSRRSRQIFEIFEQEFGGAQRLHRVMASQAGSAFTVNRILEFENAAAHTDAFAIAPYFGRVVGTGNVLSGADELAFFKALGVDGIFTWLATNNHPELPQGSLAANQTMVGNTAGAVAGWGKELVAYEGGQHFVGAAAFVNDTDLNNMLFAINRDPRMRGVYLQYLDNWKAAGGDMFMHFVNVEGYGRFGSWGALEYPTQPQANAPKFDALQTWIPLNLLP